MLRTYTTGGTPMLEFGDLTFKFFNSATVGWDFTGSAKSGQIVDGRFTAYPGCVPFAFLIDGTFDPYGGGLQLSVSGNTLTWSYPKDRAERYTRINASFAYGIY